MRLQHKNWVPCHALVSYHTIASNALFFFAISVSQRVPSGGPIFGVVGGGIVGGGIVGGETGPPTGGKDSHHTSFRVVWVRDELLRT